MITQEDIDAMKYEETRNAAFPGISMGCGDTKHMVKDDIVSFGLCSDGESLANGTQFRMDTEALRALVETATPAPWELCAHLRYENENGCTCGYRGVVYGRDHYAICQPGHDVTQGEEGLDPPRLPRAEEITNMRLIAQAPALAAEVLELRASIEQLGAERDALMGEIIDARECIVTLDNEQERAEKAEARAAEAEAELAAEKALADQIGAQLKVAEAALSDIGDAEREDGDDLEWCERRAAESIPSTRAALSAYRKARGM